MCVCSPHHHLTANPATVSVVTAPRSQKNARRSRAKTGRGEAKKAGGGGRFTWGKPGVVYEGDMAAMDENDPNYDSETVRNHNITVVDAHPFRAPIAHSKKSTASRMRRQWA
jgi:hypothetical protein